MFLRLFRKFSTATPFLLVFVGLALWVDGWPGQGSFDIPSSPAPLFQSAEHLLVQYPIAGFFIALVFLVGQAIYLNFIVTSQGLLDRQSFLTAIIYIVLMSSHSGLLHLHPALISNFFLMIALHQVFKSYKEDTVLVEVFNVGMLIALAGLFYYPALLFLLFLLISLFIFFLFSLRSVIAAFMGFTAPFFFVAVYFFLADSLPNLLENLSAGIDMVRFPNFRFSPWSAVLLVALGVIGLLSYAHLVFSHIPDKPIRIRKRFWVLVYFFLISLLSIFIVANFQFFHLALVFLPLSVGMAVFFQQARNKRLSEMVFLLLIVIILLGKWAA